jgi:hypothetical protein
MFDTIWSQRMLTVLAVLGQPVEWTTPVVHSDDPDHPPPPDVWTPTYALIDSSIYSVGMLGYVAETRTTVTLSITDVADQAHGYRVRTADGTTYVLDMLVQPDSDPACHSWWVQSAA